jgi:hypothetical protein
MHPGLPRLFALAGVAVLLAGCEDPIAPDRGEAGLALPSSVGSYGLSANAISSSQVDLVWQDNSPNEAGFEVHSSKAGAAFTLVASIGPNVTTYSDVGLTPATQYCYKVRPFKISGRKRTYSPFSTAACATTRNPPLSASDANAVPQSSNVIDIRWTDNSNNEDGFRVEQASSPGGPWTTVTTTGSNATWAQAYIWIEQQVCYHVIALSADGEAAPSNVDCTAPPLPPTHLVATSVDVQTVELRWTDNSAVEDGFEVQRWSEGFGEWTIVANVAANAGTYRDAGLSPDVTYWYLVRATKDGGYSYFSNYATAVTASTPPAAPSDVHAIPYSSTAVSIYWTDNSGNEEGFRVQRGPTDAGPWETISTTGVDEAYSYEEGLSTEQEVCYRILAFNSKGQSGPSSDCTTPPAAPSDLVATTVDHQAIDLSWTNNSPAADGFIVFRYSYPYGDFLGSVDLPKTATSYRDAGLESSSSYWYWIVAAKDGGYSDYANDAIATTAGPGPATDQGLIVMAPAPSSVIRGTARLPDLEKALSRPSPQRPEIPLNRSRPPCPSSAPIRHECPKQILQAGRNR